MNARNTSESHMLHPAPPRTRIFDYVNQELVIPEPEAQALFMPHLRDPEIAKREVLRKLNAGNPFSVIHIGDSDARFLAMNGMTPTEITQSLKPDLWKCGIHFDNIPDPAEYAGLILSSDMVLCQHPNRSWVSLWGPVLDGLIQWDLLDKRHYDEMHLFYGLIGSGLFFPHLWGKRVVLVGGKALPLYNFFLSNPDYRSLYSFLGLEHIDVASIIPMPDYRFYPYNDRKNLLNAIRESYQYKPDVFLFGAGYLARIMAVMVRDDGYIGLDMGGSFSSLMNWVDQRPGMDAFYNYQHPDYEFIFTGIDRRYLALRRNIH